MEYYLESGHTLQETRLRPEDALIVTATAQHITELLERVRGASAEAQGHSLILPRRLRRLEAVSRMISIDRITTAVQGSVLEGVLGAGGGSVTEATDIDRFKRSPPLIVPYQMLLRRFEVDYAKKCLKLSRRCLYGKR